MRIPSPNLRSLDLSFARRRRSPELVGLDIQPGYATAVQARAGAGLQVQRAAGMALPGDAMREGEVLDEGTLADALHELFGKAHLDRRVRIGVANQRTVLRMLEMPPLPEGKELAAAVRFQAEDQMPMPLENAVIDYHPLGVIDTAAGQRQRVAVVAAQRDMVERLLSAVRRAGLRPEAIDLSAFALIRALHRIEEPPADEPADATPPRVLYLNVGGLTNMAIAEGTICRFTRVVGGGLESIAAALAERNHMPLTDARALLGEIDLSVPVAPEAPTTELALPPAADEPTAELPAAEVEPVPAEAVPDARPVLESGIREIASEVRNSLDFHRTQGGGGEVSNVVLSGPALAISGFSEQLSRELGIDVRRQTVALASGEVGEGISPEHLSVAAGLAIEEVPAR